MGSTLGCLAFHGESGWRLWTAEEGFSTALHRSNTVSTCCSAGRWPGCPSARGAVQAGDLLEACNDMALANPDWSGPNRITVCNHFILEFRCAKTADRFEGMKFRSP